MLEEIIRHLKRTVPDAFIDKKPSIPWINENTRIIDSGEYFNVWDYPIFPPIFIDPDTEIYEVDEELEGEICKGGIEALAWYISFHQSLKWGIYFRVRSLSYLSNLFKTKDNLKDINERIKRAFDVLFYHEFFHFLTDIASAHMEMIYNKPLYNDYLKFLETSQPDSLHIEEPLANAYILRRIPKRYHSRIKNFFNIQPDPYSQFSLFTSDTNFLNGKRKLGAIIRHHNLSKIVAQALNPFPNTDEPFWEFVFNVDPEKLFIPHIPLYFVFEPHPNGSLKFEIPIMYGTQIAVRVNDHPPPHIHVWIPANNKKDGRYLYPSLEPYMGAPPLSNRKRKKTQKVIEIYKNKIESTIERQKQR